MKDSIFVFPDTNVLLHYPPLDQMDWSSICNSTSVTLVICLTVIHELDAKKSDSRLSDRADRAIKQIRDAAKSQAQIRPGVTVTVFNREICAADFPAMLSRESADDRIVHLAKQYQGDNPSSEVAIATADYGMELRAEAVGLPTISLESSLRLPNPRDELTRKYQEAISELNSLKNRQPQLLLGLGRPDGTMQRPDEITFEVSDNWVPVDVQLELDKVKRRHAYQSGLHSYAKGVLGRASILATIVPEERWRQYDDQLDRFYDNFRRHLELVNLAGSAKARSFEFDLWLSNDGKGMATHVDVSIHFPPNLQFFAERGSKRAELLEKNLKPPEPPEKPKPFGMESFVAHANVLSRLPDFSEFDFRSVDDWTPETSINEKDDGCYEIQVRLRKLKQGKQVCLGQFIAVFRSPTVIAPFHACFEVSASENVEASRGQLHFLARRTVADTCTAKGGTQ